MFEITFVDHDDPFYQVHNLPTYKLKCKTFEYGSEQIDTGIAEVDAIETDNSLDQLAHQVTLEQTTFTEEFRLESGEGLFLLESDTDGTSNLITETQTHNGSLLLENPVEGADASYIILESYVLDSIDERAQNDLYSTLDDNVLDFSETNPFGDAGID